MTDQSHRSSGGRYYYGGHLHGQYDTFIDHLSLLGFQLVGSGSFRCAYMRKKIVVKVPINEDGKLDNRTEAYAWRTYKNRPTSKGYQLAPCRLLANDCLLMMRVDREALEWKNLRQTHPWIYGIESTQVGKYRHKVVAFDFALNIPERQQWEKQWGTHSEFYHKHKELFEPTI